MDYMSQLGRYELRGMSWIPQGQMKTVVLFPPAQYKENHLMTAMYRRLKDDDNEYFKPFLRQKRAPKATDMPSVGITFNNYVTMMANPKSEWLTTDMVDLYQVYLLRQVGRFNKPSIFMFPLCCVYPLQAGCMHDLKIQEDGLNHRFLYMNLWKYVGPQSLWKYFIEKHKHQKDKKWSWMSRVRPGFDVFQKELLLIPLNNRIHFSMYAVWNPSTILDIIQVKEENAKKDKARARSAQTNVKDSSSKQGSPQRRRSSPRNNKRKEEKQETTPIPKLLVWRLEDTATTNNDDEFILLFINLVYFIQKMNEICLVHKQSKHHLNIDYKKVLMGLQEQIKNNTSLISKEDIQIKTLDTGINNQDPNNCGVVMCMQMHCFMKTFMADNLPKTSDEVEAEMYAVKTTRNPKDHEYFCDVFRFHLLELMGWIMSGTKGSLLPEANKKRDAANPMEQRQLESKAGGSQTKPTTDKVVVQDP